ncbi:ATP-binding cassette domain-containing protein [Mammaliicoccus sciuri]|uniref:ATP-binding cassette domain-containing protein n=1 Tax=Mammaliicoccus sciuri TaxID=1296 RepID=UPI00397D9766
MEKIQNFKKTFNNELLFEFPNLTLNKNEKIGIVGDNGVGKTTLLNILSGKDDSDEGNRKLIGYIYHLNQIDYTVRERSLGQAKKKQIFENDIFSGKYNALLLDEPTNHLDYKAIQSLIDKITKYDGLVIVISHNIEFMNEICEKIIEIENKKVNIYEGNYSKYKKIKEESKDFISNENKKRNNEIEKLKKIYDFKKSIAEKSHRKSKEKKHDTHRNAKGYLGGKAKKMSKNAEAVKKRIDSIELLEEHKNNQISFVIDESNKKYKKAFNFINCNYKDKKNQIVKVDNFYIERGDKVVIYGANGSGKTTLLEKLYNKNSLINGDFKVANDEVYFIPQDLSFTNESQSIEEYLSKYYVDDVKMKNNFYNLFFNHNKIKQSLKTLSGGEKLKIHLLRVISGNVGILLLDEPTNNLDINSVEYLEKALKEYNGTLLFVSHDSHFSKEIANKEIKIEDNKVKYQNKRLESSLNDELLSLELKKSNLIFTIGRLKDKGESVSDLEERLVEIERKIKERG